MKVIIVSGGHLTSEFLNEHINKETSELILCADGGANALHLAQIHPQVLLGDFDSINQEVFQYFVDQGVKTIRFKAEKDITDTQIAIEYALQLGATQITLLGATGSRLDHTLANIFLLEKYVSVVKCQMIDIHNKIELLTNETTKEYQKDQYPYISLVPLSKKVKGVTTDGLKFPLFLATLKRKSSYGISNEIMGEKGRISIKTGVLAVIQSKD